MSKLQIMAHRVKFLDEVSPEDFPTIRDKLLGKGFTEEELFYLPCDLLKIEVCREFSAYCRRVRQYRKEERQKAHLLRQEAEQAKARDREAELQRAKDNIDQEKQLKQALKSANIKIAVISRLEKTLRTIKHKKLVIERWAGHPEKGEHVALLTQELENSEKLRSKLEHRLWKMETAKQ